ncbi:MAG TPA: hypothetical protein VNG89_07330 [Vicinamibacterales bacterium]|nr:hypothetical protein [Vicinamibacterales bacterium]
MGPLGAVDPDGAAGVLALSLPQATANVSADKARPPTVDLTARPLIMNGPPLLAGDEVVRLRASEVERVNEHRDNIQRGTTFVSDCNNGCTNNFAEVRSLDRSPNGGGSWLGRARI